MTKIPDRLPSLPAGLTFDSSAPQPAQARQPLEDVSESAVTVQPQPQPPDASDDAARFKSLLTQQTGKPLAQKFPPNAYWDAQPPAVQKLREIDDPVERENYASQLASEGYKIDVPIMVYGWDPQTTTDLRKSYGYTWVPSALGENIAIAPGLSMPGVAPYDPNHPQANAIMVGEIPNTGSTAPSSRGADLSALGDVGAPTPAVAKGPGGDQYPVASKMLTSQQQAEAARMLLETLGFGGLGVDQQDPDNGFQIDWGNESRRPYSVGGLNAGLLLDLYSIFPKNTADAWTKALLSGFGG